MDDLVENEEEFDYKKSSQFSTALLKKNEAVSDFAKYKTIK